MPLVPEEDAEGPAHVFGLRWRLFVPDPGLHPTLPAHGPVELVWYRPGRGPTVRIVLHDREALDHWSRALRTL